MKINFIISDSFLSSNLGNTRLDDCVNCAAGKYCQAGLINPLNCEAGFYCSGGSSVPNPCQAGMNCIPGSVGPIDPNFELETCWDNPALIGTVGGGICIPGNFQK